MSLMYYTYVHIRPDTGEIFYVGKGSKNRAYSLQRNKHWHRIVAKNQGKFLVRLINWFNCEKDAFDAESWLISQLKHLGNLVNKTDGGEGISGCIRTDMLGDNNWMRSQEHIERMSGDKNPMKNPANAQKAAEKNRGQKRSPEFCEKFKGENNPMFGRTTSERQKQAVSEAMSDRPKSHVHRSRTAAKVRGAKNGMFGKVGVLSPNYGKVSPFRGKKNLIVAFTNFIRHIPYWGA